MASENDLVPARPALRLPKHLFLTCVLVGLLVPFIARLPNVPTRGWEWFTDYLPGIGFLFFGAFNLVPAGVLYGLGRASRRAPIAFWLSLAVAVAFLIWAHGTINLRSSSTAAIGLLFIPIYGAGAAIAGWVVGLVVHAIARADRFRAWSAAIGSLVMLGIALTASIQESVSIVAKEERFPVVSTSALPLVKKTVFECCSMGRIEGLSFDEFDTKSGKEIAVLGVSGVVLLEWPGYVVKSKTSFAGACDHTCIGMYPYLVADGHGRTLVASSAGVADSEGRQLWQLKREGFTRLVPLKRSGQGEPTFFSYQNMDRIDRHDLSGKVIWSVNLRAANVGTYRTKDGDQLPFAVVGHGQSSELKLYDIDGQPKTQIALPEWAGSVESIDWPSRGFLLVGRGSWLGVLDSSGKEVFKHVIQGTSFRPYHGPDGVPVRFDGGKEPYLAVMSHGSSGYARSVLLVFDPRGTLVWQEELNKLRAMVTVPRADTNAEVLLVGGMDGVIEYSLDPSAPNTQFEKDAAGGASQLNR